MSILVVGVNHRTAPLIVLERLTLTGDEISKTVAGLAARDNLREVVVLSTCNRTEVYAVTERFHGAYADRPAFISPIGVELKDLRSQSASVKDFLDTVAAMTSRQNLRDVLSKTP